jgi:hypothetical protein
VVQVTLIISWGHISALAAVLTAIGGFIAWLINRFDAAREKERLELIREINEVNAQQDRQRLVIKDEVSKLQEAEVTQWARIDKLGKDVSACVTREELGQSRREITDAINSMRLTLSQQFADGFNALSTRMDRISDRKT